MRCGILEIDRGRDPSVARPILFSVIIPTFNRAHLLGTAIDSVLNQTFKDFEILIVDNGSTDNTQEVVQGIKDARLKYLYIEPTGSPAGPRNAGLRSSRGEWVAFLDSDDVWFPEKLERIGAIAEINAYDLISHFQEKTDERGRYVGVMGPRLNMEPSYIELLTTENTFATSSVVVRREILERHELSFRLESGYVAVEDYDLWLRILRVGGKSFVLPSVLGRNYAPRNHLGSEEIFFKNMARLLSDHSDWLEEQDQRQKCLSRSRLFANLYIRRGMELLREGHFFAGLGMAISGFKTSPIQGVNYFSLRLRQRLMLPGYRHLSR
jgi:glycosyltransferase involved in cell wall biosynthesis